MKLLEYIEQFYSGNQAAFARACGVKPPQITQWINNGFIVADGALYSHRRDLPKVNDMEKLNGLKRDFYDLHNSDVKELHTPDTLWNVALDCNWTDNGMGEYVTEIDSFDSHSGNPILFEVPKNIID